MTEGMDNGMRGKEEGGGRRGEEGGKSSRGRYLWLTGHLDVSDYLDQSLSEADYRICVVYLLQK